ncbi:hypothetical protein LQW54_008597 [Pestalotiopsis sp. IQ-011]
MAVGTLANGLLARLSPPAGVFLVFFSHFFGAIHGSIVQASPPSEALRAVGVLAVGSFFLSNTIHGWNDLIDAPIDKEVARTKDRPIVRGAVSPLGAFVFTVTQALSAVAVLYTLPDFAPLASIPSVVANFYYPWSKRHTHLAQFVLGVSLGWGVVVGTAATGNVPWDPEVLAPTAYLLVSSVLWTVIYDTIYAFQEIEDDTRVGLKSTAVLFREYTKPFLWVCLGILNTLLFTYGYVLQLGLGYFVIAIGGCAASLGAMIAKVDLRDPSSCWWWFRYGFWLTGGLLWQFTVL